MDVPSICADFWLATQVCRDFRRVTMVKQKKWQEISKEPDQIEKRRVKDTA
jgi:hypothetical protein